VNGRRAFLDEGFGETRGVVTLDGAPEHLIVRRDEDDRRLQVGARLAAVVASVEPQIGAAFLDLGEGAQALLSFRPEARPARGAVMEVEVRSEPRRSKLAVVRALGPAEGSPRLLSPPPGLAETLRALAKGAEPVAGRDAREAADAAEAEVLAVVHPIPGGGRLAIEPTRALTAVDVDLGERQGSDSKRAARAANLAAIALCARLLRLKSLGGLVVIDLAGRGHDAAALLAAARAAFAPDNPGVAISPVGRFGTLELSLPRRTQPLGEILCREDGRPTARTLAARLLRAIEREAAADPGGRLRAVCAPEVAAEAQKFAPGLVARIGARFTLEADASCRRESFDLGRA
jgi:Ribonuclease G/E